MSPFWRLLLAGTSMTFLWILDGKSEQGYSRYTSIIIDMHIFLVFHLNIYNFNS